MVMALSLKPPLYYSLFSLKSISESWAITISCPLLHPTETFQSSIIKILDNGHYWIANLIERLISDLNLSLLLILPFTFLLPVVYFSDSLHCLKFGNKRILQLNLPQLLIIPIPEFMQYISINSSSPSSPHAYNFIKKKKRTSLL